jgi:YidC/Oxa1 family membrane protein insertase
MEGASVEPVQVRETRAALETTSLRVKLVPKKLVIPPNAAAAAQKFVLFIGPKKADVLDAYKALGLPAVLDYGWFSPIAIGLLWVLDAFYVFCRNYGVAIILLTVLVRVLVHPLTRKSQVAMYKMQKLRPLIEELQKKHKNDKQKLGQEQMKLFREHGANPFSGCLPLLLQMPILFALYWALRITFDLRQQPFVGWISDLSLPDTVGYLPAAVPLLGGAPINVLPLVMMIAMYLQQKMQPKPDDPTQAQQQKFMAFFPFLMGFLFYSFPSGLSLYWLLSTVLGIGEQWLIKRQLEKMPALNVVTKKK